MKKILYITLMIFFIIIILLNTLPIFDLSLFGLSVYRVVSGSMEPNIRVNDLVIVNSHSNIKENDIVTYENNGSYITHRIVKIDKEKIITKGDANNTEDNPIKRNQIKGKVIYVFSISLFINFIINNPFIWTLIILALILIAIIPTKKQN